MKEYSSSVTQPPGLLPSMCGVAVSSACGRWLWLYFLHRIVVLSARVRVQRLFLLKLVEPQYHHRWVRGEEMSRDEDDEGENGRESAMMLYITGQLSSLMLFFANCNHS